MTLTTDAHYKYDKYSPASGAGICRAFRHLTQCLSRHVLVRKAEKLNMGCNIKMTRNPNCFATA